MEGILVSQSTLINLLLEGAVLGVVIWDTVRDCPRTRRGGLHQGSQASTSRAAQPPSKGGAPNGRGGSHSGRGGSPSGRGGGRGGLQSDGGHSHCYAFPSRPKAKALDVSTYFAPSLDI